MMPILLDQIIILDDPISSFESNHLFNASSLIKQAADGAKQLFVFTHNFWFFKQLRDWMLKKKGVELSNIYVTKNGVLSDATKTLVRFHSEYHHLFHSILEYQNEKALIDSTSFTIANSVRRLLEALTNFKTPSESGFEGALQLGEKHGLTATQKERSLNRLLSKISLL